VALSVSENHARSAERTLCVQHPIQPCPSTHRLPLQIAGSPSLIVPQVLCEDRLNPVSHFLY